MESARKRRARRAAAIFPRHQVRACFLGMAAMLAMCLRGWAQASATPDAPEPVTATIHGIAGGPDGQVYEGVRVTLTSTGAPPAATETKTTDSDGAFRFSNVPPGAFRLAFSSPGFSAQTIAGILRAGESYDAGTVVLPVAATTSTVEVTASQVEIAQAQVNLEEKQRVLGVIPNYLVSYDADAAPLTTRQKFQLAWQSAMDPVSFGSAGLFAGIDQASGVLSGYGPGAQGYGKRFGAVYGDTFVGTMIGSAILPSLLRQDPRYFVKETGSVRSRVWYAVYNSVMCKGNNGRWQVNYSGLLGGVAAGGVSQLYYPASDRSGAGAIFAGTAIGTGASIFGNLAQEFVVKKLTPAARKRGAGHF